MSRDRKHNKIDRRGKSFDRKRDDRDHAHSPSDSTDDSLISGGASIDVDHTTNDPIISGGHHSDHDHEERWSGSSTNGDDRDQEYHDDDFYSHSYDDDSDHSLGYSSDHADHYDSSDQFISALSPSSLL